MGSGAVRDLPEIPASQGRVTSLKAVERHMGPYDSPNPDGLRREFWRRARDCSPRHDGWQVATGGWNVVVSRAADSPRQHHLDLCAE